MITNILQLLSLDDFYGKSEIIDIAKGKYAIPKNYIQVYKQKVRKLLSKAYANGN